MPLPAPGEAKLSILDTYTKEHSAEYQSQALIDLARRLGPQIGETGKVERIVIHTSHHTHYVIGSGAGDPQKYEASRETLDHSILGANAPAEDDNLPEVKPCQGVAPIRGSPVGRGDHAAPATRAASAAAPR
ncbi:hypothetical protein ACWDKQ_27270 [Saccharopolyspora sp. NPDC000995]